MAKGIRGELFPDADPVTFRERLEAEPDFQGAGYDRARDRVRLTGQIMRIYDAISDGEWRTLARISEITGDGEASISAQLRNLRKKDFGSHKIGRRHVADGQYEYQLEKE